MTRLTSIESLADRDAEQSLLGAFLIDPARFDELGSQLDAADFWFTDLRTIFQAIRDTSNAGESIDPITVKSEARKHDPNAAELIATIAVKTPSAATASSYLSIVKRLSQLRTIVGTFDDHRADAFLGNADPDSLIDVAIRELESIRRQGLNSPSANMDEAARAKADRLNATLKNDRPPIVPTGYETLDRDCGLKPGDLVIIGARPRTGKTAWMLGVAEYAAFHGWPTLFVTAEMDRVSITTRLISTHTGIPFNRLITGRLTESELVEVRAQFEPLGQLPLRLLDQPAPSLEQIRAEARQMLRKDGLGLIVVDYLQILGVINRKAQRQEQVAELSRELKQIARDFNVPVVVGCQLNREIEKANDQRPRLFHLRESGGIEQDADVVAFLHRPELLYESDSVSSTGVAELIIAKNRNGPMGSIDLRFDAQRMFFYELNSGTDRQTQFAQEDLCDAETQTNTNAVPIHRDHF